MKSFSRYMYGQFTLKIYFKKLQVIPLFILYDRERFYLYSKEFSVKFIIGGMIGFRNLFNDHKFVKAASQYNFNFHFIFSGHPSFHTRSVINASVRISLLVD